MTRKRGNDEGSIYFDASKGRWRGAISTPDGRVRVSGATRKEAADALVELQSKRASGLPVHDTERLGGFLDWWLGSLDAKVGAGRLSPNTRDNARWAVETWIRPSLGTRMLRDLTPEDVEALLARMAAAGRATSTVSRVKHVLAQALGTAERRNKVGRNVARVAELPVAKTPAARKALTEAQAAELLHAARGDRLEALFLVGLTLGLRPGELCGLRWKDVSIDAKGEPSTLTVAVSLKRERGEDGRQVLRLGDPKAKSGRVIALPEVLVAALRTHRKGQRREQLRAGSVWAPNGLVFCTEVGTPIDPSNLRRSFDKVTTKAGLDGWSPNELRHSAASLLCAAGVPLESVADVLGHRSTRMLERHYRHQIRPALTAHVDTMQALFGTGDGA